MAVSGLHAVLKRFIGLQVMNEAIHETRKALDADPQNAPASSSLYEVLKQKIHFLQETIESQPKSLRFMGESSGAWRPAAARRIAWEHAGEELGRVTAALAATP